SGRNRRDAQQQCAGDANGHTDEQAEEGQPEQLRPAASFAAALGYRSARYAGDPERFPGASSLPLGVLNGGSALRPLLREELHHSRIVLAVPEIEATQLHQQGYPIEQVLPRVEG